MLAKEPATPRADLALSVLLTTVESAGVSARAALQ